MIYRPSQHNTSPYFGTLMMCSFPKAYTSLPKYARPYVKHVVRKARGVSQIQDVNVVWDVMTILDPVSLGNFASDASFYRNKHLAYAMFEAEICQIMVHCAHDITPVGATAIASLLSALIKRIDRRKTFIPNV